MGTPLVTHRPQTSFTGSRPQAEDFFQTPDPTDFGAGWRRIFNTIRANPTLPEGCTLLTIHAQKILASENRYSIIANAKRILKKSEKINMNYFIFLLYINFNFSG